jgi:hypothetical protein
MASGEGSWPRPVKAARLWASQEELRATTFENVVMISRPTEDVWVPLRLRGSEPQVEVEAYQASPATPMSVASMDAGHP